MLNFDSNLAFFFPLINVLRVPEYVSFAKNNRPSKFS